MKIVDVAEFYADLGGGVRTYINQKLAAASALGHEAVIIAPGPHDAEERRPDGRILWVASPHEPLDKRYYRFVDQDKIWRLLDAEQPDVVEGSSPWYGGRAVARWPGTALKSFIVHQDTVAVYPHTLFDRWLPVEVIDSLFGWFWAYLCRLNARYDTTITAGAWLAERLRAHGLRDVAAVPFGIDKSRFSPGLRDPDLRREMLALCGLGAEATLLLTVSRHHPEKRLGTLVNAVKRANAQQPVGLVIVGDGPTRALTERAARKAPMVHIAGIVRDRQKLAGMMASADALLHGSAAETYGLGIAEALCAGLPLIVPNRGGAVDLAHPTYAEVYAPGAARDAARAILRMANRDRSAATVAARAAAVSRVQTPEAHFMGLFQHYAAALNARGQTPHARLVSAA